ncbi:hypothetical protein ACVW0Q_001733 [Thermostichus sp. MS-CIW-21]|jgi:hypothetical protein|uniref:hypothetical protein n=1 Tax=unclassified Synechococcus TaxID=2626047 RepID=UPI0000694024|nr:MULTISPECIES: hypothetical protein [unclassified Synechococcus]ABC98613.1 conserved hypothetical protein [Synechococcus sp. JA-3-3Ab]PIK85914.1 hypothetical protein SYN63AY4M2_05355 [Synechococcus sp. 63AY4M2]PIK89175.1 hypothetical protein SYN65AY6A5_09165 [Synechococcus sp. 65AY6A5]PIK91262.1 hypothetical protein SYN65AY6LI_02720 [Synechococcus sp. 65AY6Li]PIK94975.1 hypothetical protein SYN60AY4M2_05910 [Synechococcus sp. 60AY4M2]
MLLELTPEECEAVIPLVPTRLQYAAYWSDALKSVGRIITAILVGVALLVLSRAFGEGSFLGAVSFLAGFLSLLYPFLWGPLYTISRRQLAFREIPYGGLFFGQVLSTRRYEVVVEEREKVDEEGQLYIEEVRERQFEMEIGDETGVLYRVRARDDPRYRRIVKKQSVLALVKAYSRDLRRRPTLSEVYVVKLGEWVGDVSYLDREAFLELADELLALELGPEAKA